MILSTEKVPPELETELQCVLIGGEKALDHEVYLLDVRVALVLEVLSVLKVFHEQWTGDLVLIVFDASELLHALCDPAVKRS